MRRLFALSLLFAASSAGAQIGAVRGVVYDSLAGRPLAGATVQLAPAGDAQRMRVAVADSLGRFRFDSLAAGRWVAAFVHPDAELLGVDASPIAVDVPSGGTRAVTLGLGGGAPLHAMLCQPTPNDSSGALLGVLRDADSGQPLDSASVTVSWSELSFANGPSTAPRRLVAAARAGGFYVVCGVPSDADVTLRAEAPGLASGTLDIAPSARRVVRRDIALGTSPDGARTASLAGTVVDERGKPLSSAHVLVLGVDGGATTSESGAFRLGALPSGSYTVEARAIGYEPTRVSAELTTVGPASVQVAMRKRAQTLATVTIRGNSTPVNRVLEDFLRRKDHTSGYFLTPAMVDAKKPQLATDLFRAVPTMRVVPRIYGDGYAVRGPGGCAPTVYVNDMRVQDGADDLDQLLQGSDVMAVEIYRGAEAPAQYNDNRQAGCGAVVIWTKR